MIIFGTRAKYKTLKTGDFNCPQCRKPRKFEHKQAKNYFALYFIPILPIGDEKEFIECQTCGRTYSLDVLAFKPSKPQSDVARVLNTIKTKLDRGFPIEYIVSDLTLEGFDRDVAENMVNVAIGQDRKVCSNCELSYASSVQTCPDCKVELTTQP